MRYATEIDNVEYYRTGGSLKNLMPYCAKVEIMKHKIDSLIQSGNLVYSDCVNNPVSFNTNSLATNALYNEVFSNYGYVKTDSAAILNRSEYLFLILKK